MDDSLFKNKYLKYKQKYLDLQHEILIGSGKDGKKISSASPVTAAKPSVKPAPPVKPVSAVPRARITKKPATDDYDIVVDEPQIAQVMQRQLSTGDPNKFWDFANDILLHKIKSGLESKFPEDINRFYVQVRENQDPATNLRNIYVNIYRSNGTVWIQICHLSYHCGRRTQRDANNNIINSVFHFKEDDQPLGIPLHIVKQGSVYIIIGTVIGVVNQEVVKIILREMNQPGVSFDP
jgi:hypothetical protein